MLYVRVPQSCCYTSGATEHAEVQHEGKCFPLWPYDYGHA